VLSLFNPIKDMIDKPSALALDLAEILLTQKEKVNRRYLPKGILRFVKNSRLYRLDKKARGIITGFIDDFTPADKIPGLLDQYEAICTHLAITELLIAYSHMTEGKSPLPFTKTDEMHVLFKKALEDRETGELRTRFGHFAKNPFDPASRRYSEYTDDELLSVAKDYQDTEEKEDTDKSIPAYAALREELRYCALFVIAGIRQKLLAKKADLMNVTLHEIAN